MWRLLVGERPTLADLRGVDVHGAALLSAVEQASDDTSLNAAAPDTRWCVRACDGSLIEVHFFFLFYFFFICMYYE